MPTLEELMNKPAEDIKPPPLLPPGTYLVGILGYENVKSSQKQTDGIAFKYKFFGTHPKGDVDQATLAAALEESAGSLTDQEMTDTFYLTERSLFMLKQYLEDKLGIEGGRRGLREMVADAPGRQLYIHIRHRPRQDGSGFFAEIDDRAKAE